MSRFFGQDAPAIEKPVTEDREKERQKHEDDLVCEEELLETFA